MLFLDESALTIGPNSEVVLDEYVYDPEQKTGRLVLNATKGVFRLVGGRISKKTPVVLNTPTATIGIRGGISIINVAANGATDATFLFGQSMTVTSGGVTKQALRPGYTISVAAPDAALSDPAPTTPETLNAALGSLEGSGEATDDEGVPQDEDVAASGVGELGSANDPDAVAPGGAGSPGEAVAAASATDEAEGTGDIAETSQSSVTQEIASGITLSGTLAGRIRHATNPPFGTDDGESGLDFQFQGATVSNGIFDVAIASRFTAPFQAGSFTVTATEQPFGSGVLTGTGFLTSDQEFVLYELTDQGDGHKVLAWAGVPTTTFPTSGATFYNFRRDFVMDSDVPFVSKASGGSIAADLDTEADAAIFWDTSGSSSAQRPFGAVFGGLSGEGASQQSVISVIVGNVTTSATHTFLRGDMRGSSRVTTSPQSHIFVGDVDSVDDGFEHSPSQTNDFLGGTSPDYFVLGSDLPDLHIFDRLGNSAVFLKPNSVLLATTDTLETRTTQVSSNALHGYSGGAVQSIDTGSGTLLSEKLFQNDTNDPIDITVQTSAEANKVLATIGVNLIASPFTPIIAQFGDDDVTAFGTSSNGTRHSAFIDDDFFGAVENGISLSTFDNLSVISNELYMFTTESIPGLPSTITLCDCNFLRWGFWGGELKPDGGATFERIHGATWVAGRIPDLSDIPSTGMATYSGHIATSVLNGSDSYFAAGNLAFVANFGNPAASTFNVTDFDGGSFSGTGISILSASAGHTFTGSVTGTVTSSSISVSGSYLGSFVQNSTGTDKVAETGGHISLTGSGYDASGTFAAAKVP